MIKCDFLGKFILDRISHVALMVSQASCLAAFKKSQKAIHPEQDARGTIKNFSQAGCLHYCELA